MASKKEKQVVHVAPGGYRFYLKSIPQGTLLDALSQDDKPEVPEKEVEYVGGAIGTEPDYNDDNYRRDIQMWQTMYNTRIFRMCLIDGVDRVEKGGVVAGPSTDEIEKIKLKYPKASAYAVYVHWMADILKNTANGFMDLVLGQTEPTEAGIAESEAAFRPDGDGAGDPGEDN